MKDRKVKRAGKSVVWRLGMQVLLCVLLVGAGVFGQMSGKAYAQTRTVNTWAQLNTALMNSVDGDVIELGSDLLDGSSGLQVPSGKKITLDLKDKKLSLTGRDYEAGIGVPVGSELTIRGEPTGSLNVTGGEYGSGIGGGYRGDGGTIKIESGTVTATGGGLAAGIGGGFQGDGGTITIESGTVTATGEDSSAGIGGGHGGNGGTITIESGTVTATGGHSGAGIGGGYKGEGGIITINGGIVTSEGGSQGAGIGGGSFASGGTITINGGDVTANTIYLSAGIGGGFQGDGGIVKITGGIVKAQGAVEGAGIGGGGDTASGAAVTIEGGTVIAKGGDQGVGIGAALYGEDGGTLYILGGQVTAYGGEKDGITAHVIGAGSNAATPSFVLAIADGGTLTIPTNQSLLIPSGVSVINNGTIIDNGTLSNQGNIQGAGKIEGSGTLTNQGTITVSLDEQLNVTGNKYKVSFDLNGAAGTLPSPITVYATTLAKANQVLPADPTRDGYAFESWYTDATLTEIFDLNTSLTADLTAYAKWVDNRAPKVNLTTTAGNPTNKSFNVTATFNEPVTDWDQDQIQTTNGKVENIVSVNPSTYTFDIVPINQGLVTVKILSGASKDAVGNLSEESNMLERTYLSTAPILLLNGQTNMAVGIGTNFIDPGATAKDALENDLTANIAITGDTVDANQAGTYVIQYDVKDTAGNTSSVTRTVYVIEPPVVKLSGAASMTLEEGKPFADPGATASDTFHGDLSEDITVTGTVDTSKPGVYTLEYSMQNPIGQTGKATRTVTVTKKETSTPTPTLPSPVVTPPSSPIFTAPPVESTGVARSTTGSLTLAAGQAGEVSLGSDAKLQIPSGATSASTVITMNILPSANNGLANSVKTLSNVYEMKKTVQANFLRPVNLTLTFDPTKLARNEKAAVFYQTNPGEPWVQVEGGIIELGRDAIGTAKVNTACITVPTDHFTRFAVLAVSNTATPPDADGDADSGSAIPSIAFTDLSGNWAAGVITQAASLGWVTGYADGTFRPSQSVTRAEFIAMMTRVLPPAAGATAASGSAEAKTDFADQSSIANWAEQPIAEASSLGWVQGDASGKIRPNAPISRAEMATMLYRALAPKGGANEAAPGRFTDAEQIPAWAQEAVASLSASGIIQGGSDGKFAPNAHATRAETVQVLVSSVQ
ncbi:immunoglobulin-like domain-containing protein [Saccharibacillus sp. JS10]|uniref:immunoglobulin-like domain-containing protein n=1 Tax=Saccharibacillus sp. JS10 TaxID=2950552 RepID=UPI0021094FE1|nr:immunoglobulin-like domain-containing protein [Saccharibacillus sp. JS10]MCQ4087516.1 DUF5011 domain-containing protein [Saccharibacillus sp. JS10]